MQAIGYIMDNRKEGVDEKVLLLVRQGSYYRALKRRLKGKDGIHFIDEEKFLNLPENYDILDNLKGGKVLGI